MVYDGERARIVLRAADGLRNQDIAAESGITPEKAARWRNRFLDGGLAALEKDAPRPGQPRTVPASKVKQIVQKTTQEKPPAATHWSTRTMATAVGVSESTVRRIWHAHGLKPHMVATFKCALLRRNAGLADPKSMRSSRTELGFADAQKGQEKGEVSA